MKMPVLFASLSLLVLTAVPSLAAPSDTSVVVFSRHSFRGVTHRAGPQNLAIPELGLALHFPMLSYAMELSPRGGEIARRFASNGLNQAAAMAIADAHGAGPFGGWDEIRIDMSTSRDFFTAASFKDALDGAQSHPIALTGTPTTEDQGVDPVSLAIPVMRCIPKADIEALRQSSPTLPRLRTAAERLLSLLKDAGVISGWKDLPRGYSELYWQVTVLASSIEMASDLGGPLEQLFPNIPAERLKPIEAEAVRRASGFIGIQFATAFPIELARARAAFQVAYINATAPGHHVIVASHDDDVSSLLRALELVSDTGQLDDLVMYPLESVVFATNSRYASVVRLRLKLGDDGVFTGATEARVIWHGSRAEWDAKAARLKRLAQEWAPGAAERARLPIPPAEPLDALLKPR